jgi:hypothetical protein
MTRLLNPATNSQSFTVTTAKGSDMQDDQDFIAALRVSFGRRFIGCSVLAALTILFAVLAVQGAGTGAVAFGLAAALSAGVTVGIWQVSAREVVMKPTGLFDSNGAVIVTLDQIERINSGPLSIRPSNGFSIRLTSRQSAHWAPGLWWRWGRMVGIGGLTSAKPSRDLANLLQTHHTAFKNAGKDQADI